MDGNTGNAPLLHGQEGNNESNQPESNTLHDSQVQSEDGNGNGESEKAEDETGNVLNNSADMQKTTKEVEKKMDTAVDELGTGSDDVNHPLTDFNVDEPMQVVADHGNEEENAKDEPSTSGKYRNAMK